MLLLRGCGSVTARFVPRMLLAALMINGAGRRWSIRRLDCRNWRSGGRCHCCSDERWQRKTGAGLYFERKNWVPVNLVPRERGRYEHR